MTRGRGGGEKGCNEGKREETRRGGRKQSVVSMCDHVVALERHSPRRGEGAFSTEMARRRPKISSVPVSLPLYLVSFYPNLLLRSLSVSFSPHLSLSLRCLQTNRQSMVWLGEADRKAKTNRREAKVGGWGGRPRQQNRAGQ